MKFVENTNFNNYVELYKKLPLKTKKEILEKEFQELLTILEKIDKNHNEVLYNKEILDIRKENQTEDDFVEAIFVYLYSIKELLGNYINDNQQ